MASKRRTATVVAVVVAIVAIVGFMRARRRRREAVPTLRGDAVSSEGSAGEPAPPGLLVAERAAGPPIPGTAGDSKSASLESGLASNEPTVASTEPTATASEATPATSPSEADVEPSAPASDEVPHPAFEEVLAAADPSAIRIAGDSSYRSLEEARSDAESATVLCGDDGGQIYLTVPTRYVACDERTLRGLLVALDAMEWNEPAMATLAFRRAPVGSNLFAGLGGATVIDGVWVHPRLEDAGVRAAAASVIYGRQTLAEVVRELAALARLR